MEILFWYFYLSIVLYILKNVNVRTNKYHYIYYVYDFNLHCG